MIKIVEAGDRRAVRRLLARSAGADAATERRVARIVGQVRRDGDTALRAFARRVDGLDGPIEVGRREIADGWSRTPRHVRSAMATAARHIRRVAARQVPRPGVVRVAPGVTVEQRVTPLDRVGCYVPGGRHPLPSSLLMTALPARVAGVDELLVVCPRPEPAVLCAALEAGVDRLFRVGGAHAVAALAYGTRTVPRVDKIVGPGSAWVAAAKTLVSRDCAIDFHAGPSEIVVLARTADPDWIAADLLAQAEHDVDARAILLTPNRALARRVARAIAAALPGEGPARAALARHGAIVVTRDLDEAIELANALAPEHLVCPDVDRRVAERAAAAVTRAGATFVGPWTAQAAGDYATGSNHVLPTAGAARFRGGLSAADFVRVSSVQRLTRAGLARLAPHVIALAEAEGLHGHAASIRVRAGRKER